ncbi:MAG: serine hydrolase domain-containing protein [Nitrospiraceae bacterium]
MQATQIQYNSDMIEDYALTVWPPVAQNVEYSFLTLQNGTNGTPVTELLTVSDQNQLLHFFRDSSAHSGWGQLPTARVAKGDSGPFADLIDMIQNQVAGLQASTAKLQALLQIQTSDPTKLFDLAAAGFIQAAADVISFVRQRGRRRTAFLVGAVLLSAGCSAVPTPSAPTASGLKPIDQAALQSLVDTTIKELLVPGAVVRLRTPEGDFTAAGGTTQLNTPNPPGADTYFRIASNTKTMTAAVIMQLAQESRLSVDDKVSMYVPGVPNGDKISIAELLEMRSGLYNYTNAPEVSASIDHNPSKVWSREELLAIAFARPTNFPPGSRYEYNNTNYALLGLIIEKVDRKPLAQAMQDRLFGPLKMPRTVLPARTVNTIPTPYSHGYLYGSSSVALVGEPPYSPEVIAAAKAGTLLPKDYTGVNHSFAEAAGGVISTANDLTTWIKALVGGRVLNAEYQRRWLDSLKPEVPSKPEGQKYGYGISQLSWGPNTIYFHGGETPGYNSKISYDPANDMTLVVWTNLPVSLDDEQTANTLWVKVLDQIYKVSPLAPAPPPSPTAGR